MDSEKIVQGKRVLVVDDEEGGVLEREAEDPDAVLGCFSMFIF